MKKDKLKPKARVEIKIHDGKQMRGQVTYLDKQAYISQAYEDITNVLAHGELSGLIKDKRVQPNSITITFNLI